MVGGKGKGRKGGEKQKKKKKREQKNEEKGERENQARNWENHGIKVWHSGYGVIVCAQCRVDRS